MRAKNIRWIMPVALGWICGWMAWGQSFADVPPGGVLPATPPSSPAQGRISGSAIAADGSLLLRGDFTRVNDIARPGLAKLLPDGRLDTSFEPEAVAISGTDIPYSIILMGTPISEPLVALADGTWVHAFPGHPLAYRPDGTLDPRYTFLSGCEGTGEILFETATTLYLFRNHPDGRRMEAVLRDTFEPQPLNEAGSWPKPAVNAAPSADGGLWVLGRDVYDPFVLSYPPPPPFILFRAGADGELDPAFAPQELAHNRHYRIEPRTGGGFRLVHWYESSWLYLMPMPSVQCYTLDDYDALGTLVASRSACVPRGHSLLHAEEADGSILHNIAEMRDGRYIHKLVRQRTDGTQDPDFCVELETLNLKLLPDGRIHHSHIRRIMPDGTPDPSWQTPLLITDPTVSVVGVFADGGILVHRDSARDDPAVPPLIVLDDGLQPDPSFQAAPDLPSAMSYHITRDGLSVLIALSGIHEFADGTRTRILRLQRDGTIDPDSPRYLPHDGNTFIIYPETDPVNIPYTGSFQLQPLPGGAMLVHYIHPDREVPSFSLARLLPDGTPDPTFAFAGTQGMLPSVFALPDGSFLIHNQHFATNGSLLGTMNFPRYGSPVAGLPDGRVALRYYENETQQLAIWDFNSGVVPGFSTDFQENTWINRAVPLPDGTWVVEGDIRIPAGPRRMVRLYADGRVDPTFIAPAASRTLPWTTGLWNVVRGGSFVSASFTNRMRDARMTPVPLPSNPDALLIAGDFTDLNGQPRAGLALLSLHRLNSFAAWREQVLGNEVTSDPADHLENYATGIDPADTDRSRGLQTAPGETPAFRLFLNPDAADVTVAFEVSSDMHIWRDALPGEVQASPEPNGLRLEITEGQPSLFLRTRYRTTIN